MPFVDRTLHWQRRLVALILAGTALAFSRAAYSVFGSVKLTVVVVGVIALVTISALRVARTRRLLLPRSVALAAVGAFLLLLTVATLASHNTPLGLVGHAGRYNGLLVYLVYGLLFALAIRLYREHSPAHLLGVLAGLSVPVALYGLVQWSGNDPYTWGFEELGPPMFGTLGNPNFFAGWLGIVSVAGVYGAWRVSWSPLRRVASGVAGVLALGTAFVSQSMQGPAAGAVGVGFFLLVALLSAERLSRAARLITAAAGVAVGLGGLAAFFAGVGPLGVIRTMVYNSYRSRAGLWETAWTMAVERPLVGFGPATFREGYFTYRSLDEASFTGLFRAVDTPHSVPLEMFTAGGFPVGLAYLAVWVVVAWSLAVGLRRLRGQDRLLLGAFGGVWLAYLTQSLVSIDVPPLATIGWLSAGVIVALGAAPPLQEVVLPGAPALPSGRGRPGKRKKERVVETPLAEPSTALLAGIGVAAAMALAVGILPLIADYSAGRARVLSGANRGAAAAELYERATRIAFWEPRYPADLAALYGRMRQWDKAMAAHREAISREPRGVFRLETAAKAAIRADRLDLADKWYDRLYEIDTKTLAFVVEVGQHRLNRGDPEGSREVFARAVELYPNDAGAWVGLAVAAEQLGDVATARAAYERALQIDPSATQASEALARLG